MLLYILRRLTSSAYILNIVEIVQDQQWYVRSLSLLHSQWQVLGLFAFRKPLTVLGLFTFRKWTQGRIWDFGGSKHFLKKVYKFIFKNLRDYSCKILQKIWKPKPLFHPAVTRFHLEWTQLWNIFTRKNLKL